MTPRKFINFFRSPTGALLIFALLLGGTLAMIITFKPHKKTTILAPARTSEGKPQTVKTVDREISKFTPPAAPVDPPPQARPRELPQQNPASPPPAKVTAIPSISLFAEIPKPDPPKPLTKNYAPFGRLIRCELVITVDSSAIETPIIGLVTDDVWHRDQLIIPAGTEVHSSASADRSRERIASAGTWTLVWQDGKELTLNGVALDREKNPEGDGWAITDGSSGLRGKLLKTDNLAEIKLFAATFLSGAADALTEKEQTVFGTQSTPSLNNAPFEGAQDVLAAYARQIFAAIERDGFYVRVPAGKQFYLYATETIDVSKAAVGINRSETNSPNR